MAKIIGSKSNYLSAQADLNYSRSLYISYLATGVAGALTAQIVSVVLKEYDFALKLILTLLILAIEFPLIFYLIKHWRNYKIDGHRFIAGKAGEDIIMEELEKLSDDYVIFPDLIFPGRKGNVDCIVVAPQAIFLMEIKNHKGKITYDRRGLRHSGILFDRNILKQVETYDSIVTSFLSAPLNSKFKIIPMLVFSNKNSFIPETFKKIGNIYLVQRFELIKFIEHTHGTEPYNHALAAQVLKSLANASVK